MITTLDGKVCKRGTKVWEIGAGEEGFVPVLSCVHGGKNDVVNPYRTWASYALCLAECKVQNDLIDKKSKLFI